MADEIIYCSFCGKGSDLVEIMIKATGPQICNECVDVCSDIIRSHREAKGHFEPSEWRRIERYKPRFIEGSTIAIVWATEDVMARAKELDKTITEERAIDILGSVESNHDANFGISWETFDSYISQTGEKSNE